MQVEEESPKQYVDIARDDDDEMRPARTRNACGAFVRPNGARNGEAVAQCPVPSGYGQNTRLLRRVACKYRHICCAPLLASIVFWP